MKTLGARVADLLRLVQRDYADTGKRSGYTVNLYINNQLLPHLGARVANHVRKGHIEEYKTARKKDGASEVTINRELAVLKRAFSLGIEEELIERKPFIKMYPEPEPREGHYEHDEFMRFQDACRQLGAHQNYDGEMTADIVMFGYYSGWRLRECLQLHKDWVRVQDKIVVLPKAKHKNKSPKIYPLEGKVWTMIEKRLEHASPDGMLFHRNGKPVKSIRRICATVCDIVKIDADHFFHNLRRSCTTNLNRAGVDKETGKKITGHKTDSVYNNYNQHTVESLRVAVRKVEEYLEITTIEKQVPNGNGNGHDSTGELAERGGFEPPLDVKPKPDFESSACLQPPEKPTLLTRLWRKITQKGAD